MGSELGLAAPSPAGVPSPQGLGYSSVVLERLAQHARGVLGFRRAWIVARRPDEADAVARRARDRSLREHRWLHRYVKMLQILGILADE